MLIDDKTQPFYKNHLINALDFFDHQPPPLVIDHLSGINSFVRAPGTKRFLHRMYTPFQRYRSVEGDTVNDQASKADYDTLIAAALTCHEFVALGEHPQKVEQPMDHINSFEELDDRWIVAYYAYAPDTRRPGHIGRITSSLIMVGLHGDNKSYKREAMLLTAGSRWPIVKGNERPIAGHEVAEVRI
ncbi:hypothetical protein [Rhizobium metallidurans]|uniref:Uncharacterized protein n=1 Tax=Rhizobium metallidurans TaxID=1265931 RepID=A0A7W6GCY7_9HYPH|nr:hypothetical protein [Rhizobium metallidurans]MBB3967328.1 hypothetical protein [Rhizobium metallidurans]